MHRHPPPLHKQTHILVDQCCCGVCRYAVSTGVDASLFKDGGGPLAGPSGGKSPAAPAGGRSAAKGGTRDLQNAKASASAAMSPKAAKAAKEEAIAAKRSKGGGGSTEGK